MQDTNLFALFTDKLDNNKIEYFITGSIASIVYGEPRLTHDIDLVISLNQAQVNSFINSFPIDDFYCPPQEVIITELNRHSRGHFNLIHHKTGFKADIYFIGKDELQLWAMKFRKKINFIDKVLFVAPPEYVIIKKMEFYKEGKADKHINDIKAIIENSAQLIDFNFISVEIKKRGLEEIWNNLVLSN